MRMRGELADCECSACSRSHEGGHTIPAGRVEHFAAEDREPLRFHACRLGSLAELMLA